MTEIEIVLVLFAVLASFVVSASAGLGGSLVLVPTLALVLGTKEGVALAALLLGLNNIAKVIAYRRVIPFRASLVVVIPTLVAAVVGASLLVAAPTWAVNVAVIGAIGATLIAERQGVSQRVRRSAAPVLATASGLTSGFSGTSGPLKGVAIRSLGFDARHMVGAASLVSLVGDLAKAATFAEARLLGVESLAIAGAAVPLMALGTWTGYRLNGAIGEVGYARLFWLVMGGYAIRLVVLA